MKPGVLSVSTACGFAIAIASLMFAGGTLASGQTAETTLYLFGSQSGDGQQPAGPVIFDMAGNLYGTSVFGGEFGYGAVFELSPPTTQGGPWSETTLYSFTGGLDGNQPSSGLILDSDGALYGEAAYGGYNITGTVFKLTPPAIPGGAWTETTIYAFCSGGNPCIDGARPTGGLVFDNIGNLYGTATIGGSGGGAVFELSPPSGGQEAWTEKVLHNFVGHQGDLYDGDVPQAGVIFDSAGNLYGTTLRGGNSSACSQGCGLVFELSPTGGIWTESILYAFQGASDGASPEGGLAFDNLGSLYGTNDGGGAYNQGNVFKLTPPAWTESVLYSFQGFINGSKDGYSPAGGLIFSGTDLLGTTAYGGSVGCGDAYGILGCGTVFRLAPPISGTGPWTEDILWNFASGSEYPAAGLVLNGGSFYGTTYGAENGDDADCFGSCGGVFELSPAAPTSTTLAPSLNPSTVGQSVTLTATVAPQSGSGTPTGTVTFKFGYGGIIGTAVLSGGQASLSYTFEVASTKSITAVYSGDSNFAGSTSSTLSQVVNPGGTLTSLTSSLNPSQVSQGVTLTATVAPQSGSGTPTGTVTFKLSSGGVLNTVFLNSSGQASFSYNFCCAGTNSIIAVYSGDTNNAGSTSSALSQVVNPGATLTSITSSLSPSTVGQAVTLTATVVPQSGSRTPTGTVTFKFGYGGIIGAVTLSGGQASLSYTFNVASTKSITAVYSGDPDNAASTSSTLSQLVTQANTTTTVTSSLNPAQVGQSVTFTATTIPQYTGTPTGTVTFTSNENGTQAALGTATLSGGQASVSYTYLVAASRSVAITAVYSGDTNFTTSTGSTAQNVPVDSVQTLTVTRTPVAGSPPVSQSFIFTPVPAPSFVVILLPGGNGDLELTPNGTDGTLDVNSNSFVARARWLFASYGFDIITLDAATDFQQLSGELMDNQSNPAHITDILQVIAWARSKVPAGTPVWIVGASRGTAGAFVAAQYGPGTGPDGLVFTNPVNDAGDPDSPLAATLSNITVPVLILTDNGDTCPVSPASGDVAVLAGLTSSPLVGSKTVPSGGLEALTSNCNALSDDGFFGKEGAAVKQVAPWIVAAP